MRQTAGGGSTQGQEERVVSQRLLAQPHHRWAGFWAQATFQSRKNPGLGRIPSKQAFRVNCTGPQHPGLPTHPAHRASQTLRNRFPFVLFPSFAAFCNCHFLKHPGGSVLRPTVCHSSNLSPRTLDLSFFKKAENAPSSFISKASSLFVRCQERKLSSGWLAVCANCLPTL